MPIEFLVESALRPGVPSAKAYQLAFADDAAYFIFLARDWGGFRQAGGAAAHVPGNLGATAVKASLDAAVNSTLGNMSRNKIADKLSEIKGQDFDALVAADPKNSVKISYADIVKFKHKAKSWLSGNAYVLFKLSNGKKYKFCFWDEAPREGVVKVIKEKRGDLVK